MTAVVFEVLAIAALVVINGVLSMSEAAVIAARKPLLGALAKEGRRNAGVALSLARDPGPFLSTVQVGITLLGVLSGAIGGATLAGELAGYLRALPWIEGSAYEIALSVVVLTVAFFSVVIGELVPKRLALANAERVACSVAPPMQVLSRLMRPVVRALSWSSSAVLKLARYSAPPEAPVTDKEIRFMIDEGVEQGVIHQAERELVERVFRLGDRTVGQIMVPRTRIAWVDLHATESELRLELQSLRHSRVLVCEGNLDSIVGFVRVRELLLDAVKSGKIHLQAHVQAPLYVPESMKALTLLDEVQRKSCHLAVIVDEFGGTAGLVTVNDIAQALVGDLPFDETTRGPGAVLRPDGSWLVDGALPSDQLYAHLGMPQVRAHGDPAFETVAGLVLNAVGRVPRRGERVTVGPLSIEVLEMDRNRIDKVLVRRAEAATR
jgi:putative hemolysin